MESSESTEILESQTPETQPSPPQPLRTGLWMALGLLLIGGGVVLWRSLLPPVASQQAGGPGGPPQSSPVKLQRLQPGVIEEGTSFVGNLEAQTGIELKPKVEGRVTQIFVSSGATVQSGRPIVQLSAAKSQAEFRASLATISSARADRNSAQAQLGVTKAERASALAEVDLQKTEYNRISQLVKQGVLARRELDRVTRDLNSAQAALSVANEQIQAAQANIEATEAAMAENKANASALREDLLDTQVVAPIGGVVGDIPVKVGDYIDVGETLTTITQNQTLEIKLAIPLERRDQLRVGLPVEVRSFQNNETLATGNISFISPTANAATQSVLAKATFSNANGTLQDAQRVSGTVIWKKRTGVLVPTTAISRLGGETFVFVAKTSEEKPDALVAQQRPVQLGNIQGNSYQVISGLRPGETIVVSGILNLSDGAPIKAQSES
ncbi:MAG: efflux RND transporter periplasmic adaptor subunit [Thermosynechococcaceae cyanobacterium]